MMNANVVMNQDIVTFVAEGRKSVFEAMKEVNGELSERLEQLRASGLRPVVSSISHSSGHDGFSYYASLVVVLSLH